MKYRLVRYSPVESGSGPGFPLVAEDFSEGDFIAAMLLRGFPIADLQEPSLHLRPELVGQPKFDGFAGPSWGGEEDGSYVIRYEDWEAYRVLTS